MPGPSPSSPPPAPASVDGVASTIFHGVWQGIVQVAHTSPWLIVLAALAVIASAVRSARIAIHYGPKDPTRLFSRRDKQLLLYRAGDRCERHTVFGWRCQATTKLEADHIHPHSRGGWTNVANGQILCQSHNRAKTNRIPFDRTLRRLAERRAAYYPPNADRLAVRRDITKARRNRTSVTPG